MFAKFITFLKFEEQLLKELVRLSERQQTAIVKNDYRELQEINSYQVELNKNLIKTEDERFLILATWLNINKSSARSIKLSELKKYINKEELTELKIIQNNFETLINQLYTLNSTNRLLINRARINIKEMIDYITNGTQIVCNYKV